MNNLINDKEQIRAVLAGINAAVEKYDRAAARFAEAQADLLKATKALARLTPDKLQTKAAAGKKRSLELELEAAQNRADATEKSIEVIVEKDIAAAIYRANALCSGLLQEAYDSDVETAARAIVRHCGTVDQARGIVKNLPMAEQAANRIAGLRFGRVPAENHHAVSAMVAQRKAVLQEASKQSPDLLQFLLLAIS